ncbi:MAG TPA: S41 family peptidase [Longimicrobium sp.]|jgi:hypothetical protein
MRILLALAATLAASALAAQPAAQPASCEAALDSLQTVFRRDYPGYRTKVAGREAELAALTDSVRAVVRTSEDHRVCVAQGLQRWVRFFRDPHVMLWQAGPPPPPSSAAAPASADAPAPEDPGRPTLRFRDDSTAILRIPDLDAAYKGAVDSLVAASRARLLRTPYLLVDVRGNGGGCTCTYESIVPLFYTGPIAITGNDVWSSEGNLAAMREWSTDPVMPEGIRRTAAAVVARMEANPGRFVPWVADTTLRMDTVYPQPRAVGVLVDAECASSCENLVLDAMQSRKVTVAGAGNTKGVGDYGNVRSLWLPGWRRLRIPTSRSRRLPRRPIDGIGIPPQLRIPAGEADPVEFTLRHLRARR